MLFGRWNTHLRGSRHTDRRAAWRKLGQSSRMVPFTASRERHACRADGAQCPCGSRCRPAHSPKSESEGILLEIRMLIPSSRLSREDATGKPYSMDLREGVVS